MNNLRAALEIWCLGVGFASFLVLSYVFFKAYFSPSQAITLFVNREGEGFLESIVLGLSIIPMLFFYCYYGVKKLAKINTMESGGYA